MIFSIADTFIRRPVLSTVCTIIIVLLGGVCIPLLPIEYLPQIAPIQVSVTSNYTGADPETIETTVTTPIERKINGTQNMEYMTSTSVAGASNIQVFFGVNTDKNINQVNVQNNVSKALPLLPATVQQQGVTVQTASTSILRAYGLYSPDNKYDAKFISNYADLYITDEIARLEGVGKVTVWGQLQYAMRFWLNPNALATNSLTVIDVVNAIKAQNLVVGGGSIGQEPVPPGQQYQIPLQLDGMFKSVADAENMMVKVASNGTQIKLKDLGRVELGAQSYAGYAKVNGKPGIGLGIYQQPGSNAVDVANLLESKLEELKKDFPPGLELVMVYDTVAFIEESTKEVIVTLIEAIALVILVIFVFLQDWRTTIIPAIAIPVSLIGALAFAKVLDFSINSLTMLGLVLATGLVVDDGILVVEAISTKMQQGMSAREASHEAMNELGGAIIATSLVLMAVFVPVSFFPGATGLMYKQFALIIVFSIAVSTFNALSFSPTLAALLLRPAQPPRGPLGWFFSQFNRGFFWLLERYKSVVETLIRMRYLVLALFAAGLVATVYVFGVVPTGFVPPEDQGSLLGFIQAPDISSLQNTEKLLDRVEQEIRKVPEVDQSLTASGYGFNGSGPNQGIFFAHLIPWSQRSKLNQHVFPILKNLNPTLAQAVPEAKVAAFSPPPISGFSPTGGINMQLQDTTGGRLSFQEFQNNADEILQKANDSPVFGGKAFTQFSAKAPQYRIQINRDQLNALNINFNDALAVLGTSIGSSYVSQFVYGPRYYQIYVQLDGEYRNNPEDLNQIYVRSNTGQMVSMDQVITITPYTGPAIISHFNQYRSILLQGNQDQAYSSGEGIKTMQSAYEEATLPGVKYAWSDLTREEVSAGNMGAFIFLFGIIMVFLVLAAQYESYIDPSIILLTVPLAILGALGAIALRRLIDPFMANNVYTNIALVMLIGLASKNAILIVEFANQAHATGKSFTQSALTAAEERLRPILMTALSALVGFWPLVVASGAGANSRHALGTAVFGGLLVATFLSLLVVPVLYVVIKTVTTRFFGSRTRSSPPTSGMALEDAPIPPAIAEGATFTQPNSPVQGDSSTT